jgi:hypothetical protein
LAGARASGDTRIAGELICKSLMKCGPSKTVPASVYGRPSAIPLTAVNQSPALRTSSRILRISQIIDR